MAEQETHRGEAGVQQHPAADDQVDAALRQIYLRYGLFLNEAGAQQVRTRLIRLNDAGATLLRIPLQNAEEPAWQFVPPRSPAPPPAPKATDRE